MLPPEEGRIGLVDVYAEQLRTGERVKILTEQLPDHETRLRELERWRYALPASLATAVASGILAIAGLLARVHGG